MMQNFNVSKSFPPRISLKGKPAELMRMFGLTADALRANTVTHKCSFRVSPGQIVYITGPSGAGKSVLLNEIQSQIDPADRINIGDIELPADRTVIECLDQQLTGSLRTLSTAGLSDVFALLNRPVCLSKGQKYRFALAQAIANGRRFIIADELAAHLDSITASVIAWKIRRFADDNKVTFLLAGTDRSLLADLSPDVLIEKHLSGPAEVTYKRTPGRAKR